MVELERSITNSLVPVFDGGSYRTEEFTGVLSSFLLTTDFLEKYSMAHANRLDGDLDRHRALS